MEWELDNLRAALDLLEASGENEGTLRLAGALSDFWAGRGHIAEGRRRLERALEGDERPTASRAKALNGASTMAQFSQDHATTRLRAEEALALHRRLGSPRGEAESLSQLGYAAGEEGNWQRAQQLLEETVGLLRDLGEEHFVLWAVRTLAWTYAEAGDLQRARTLYEDGLRRARALGSPPAEAALLGSLAWLAVSEGRPQHAPPLLKQSLLIKRDIGDRMEIAIGLCSSARALTALGNPRTAAQLISCFEALRDEIGGIEAWVTRMSDETLPTIRAQLDDAAFAEAWEQGRTLTADEAVALALTAFE
jgi:tetratricopeptide (TPR) repeat protein